MCKSHLVKGLGIIIAVLLCIGVLTSFAGGASQDGVALKISGMPFNQLVTELVKQKGGKKLLLLENVSTPVDIVAPEATPIDKILATLSSNVGLDFWQDDDTYYIGKRSKYAGSQANSSPVMNIPDSPVVDSTPIQASVTALSPAPMQPSTKNDDQTKQKPVIAAIELKNTSATEMAWMLGVQGGLQPSANRKRSLNNRINTILNPRKPNINMQDNDNYSSPMLQSSSPWLSGVLSRNSSSDAYQQNPIPQIPAMNPFGQVPFGGMNPQGQVPGAPTGGVVANPTNNTNTNNNNSSDFSGLLKAFLPDGIEAVVGIESLNKLLVRAKSQEAVDQLADFIKILDQPTKQALVEVMFVKMSVNDATSFGASWSITGTPWSVNNVGLTDGRTSVQYSQGNIKLALNALIQQQRAKIVNAPRVIVQNGGYADIELSDNIPFVITSEEEDVYGKVTKVPTINMQTFSQGLEVNNILIHPDDSVTLDVYPVLEDPSGYVTIPGQDNSGSVSGSNEQTIQTIVRVKNGETIMMGGFVSDNNTTLDYKTPLLSNLPILGPLLFRSRSETISNTETLIFITPTVLKDDTTSFEGMTTLPPLF
ncbi:MAG TPA: hypothetical protein VHV83_20675 [Armatimonadota bacterium]|nr:hypothetical protein [Armatimonadota bacterium]